jgi:putative metallohydrolase (TIGR04338 family)
MSRLRDSQRSRVYKAEATLHLAAGRRFETLPLCQAYADHVLQQAHSAGILPFKRITVLAGWGGRRAGARPALSEITLPRWSRSEAVILHELAHIINGRLMNGTPYAHHGEEYVARFVRLVHLMKGPDVARDLIRSFREHKVRGA